MSSHQICVAQRTHGELSGPGTPGSANGTAPLPPQAAPAAAASPAPVGPAEHPTSETPYTLYPIPFPAASETPEGTDPSRALPSTPVVETQLRRQWHLPWVLVSLRQRNLASMMELVILRENSARRREDSARRRAELPLVAAPVPLPFYETTLPQVARPQRPAFQ